MLPRKSGNYTTQKIFINNLNSWFSNFLIEEFRTDYLPDAKLQTKITGTLDPNGGPLPKLFEPELTSIELGYNYSQDIFDNDIFIFNLDDSFLPEVEFIIRGLQNTEYDKEKILILISNVMTWGETPLKIYTEEDMKKEGFNEEEVPEIEDDIEEKNEEVKNEENKENDKDENPEEKKEEEIKENKNSITGSINNKDNDNKRNSTIQKDSTENDKNIDMPEGQPEEEKQIAETIEEEEYENESQIKKEEEKEKKEPEKPKTKIFYYHETEYQKRSPNLKYIYYKILENKAILKNNNPKLKSYVICPGFIYGCGEDFFFNYFRMAWMQQMSYIPLVGEGKNFIPTIHILDLIKVIRKVVDKKPEQKYFFVCDKTKNPTLKNILNSVGMGIGGLGVKKMTKFSIEHMEIPNYTELKIDLRMKLSNIFEEQRKSKENIIDYKERQFKWHCEFGIPENIDKIREEFNLYRNLKPIKIIVTGPPCGGKSTLCEFLTKKYNLNNYKINQICDWAKNLNNALGEETKQHLQEIEENIVKALDDYEHRKNKRKTDPPLDTSQLKKFSSEFMGKLLKERLSFGDCGTKGYILDNYPKTYEDCVNMFCTTPFDKEKKDKYEIDKKIIPDSVIIINNYLEENLRTKLQKTEGYEENQQEIDFRFNRRLNLHKQQNEIMEDNKKFTKDFFKENNIDVYFLDEQKYMLNKDEEEKKVIEFLERNGPIDNYSNLHDIDEIIPYVEVPLGDNINMPNEEQVLFEQNGPYNFGMNKKVDIIKEENEINLNENNNNNANLEGNNKQNNENNNINNQNNEVANNNASKQSNKENKDNKENKENIDNKENKEINEASKLNVKAEKSMINNKSRSRSRIKKKEETEKKSINEEKEKIPDEKEEDKEKEEEKNIIENNNEIQKELTQEQKIEIQLKQLAEREKKLLEKKSEVLRRYISENVMPLLAKGILTVCETMPDDPVDALANFLLENSFNIQGDNGKEKIGDIEKILASE